MTAGRGAVAALVVVLAVVGLSGSACRSGADDALRPLTHVRPGGGSGGLRDRVPDAVKDRVSDVGQYGADVASDAYQEKQRNEVEATRRNLQRQYEQRRQYPG